MILRNRLYERKEPDRDATLCIIYCEGSKREPQYFKYFEGLSSRIILEVVKAESQGDNSPVRIHLSNMRWGKGIRSGLSSILIRGGLTYLFYVSVVRVKRIGMWRKAIPVLKFGSTITCLLTMQHL